MSVPTRWAALALTGLLLTACGEDDSGGGGGAEGSDDAPATESTEPTTPPEPTAVWVGSSEASALLKVDPTTGAVQEFPVDEGPWKLEYADGSLWARTPELQQLDPASGQPTSVLFEEIDAYDFLVDGDGVWMSLNDEPKLVRYDLATGKPEDEVRLPSEDLSLENLVPYREWMLAENAYDATVVRIDMATGEVAATYNPDEIVWDVQLVGDSLWVAHYGGLVELDAETLQVRSTVPGVEEAFALDVDETGQVWVGLDDMVGTIDGSTGQLVPAATVANGTGGGVVDDIEVTQASVWLTHEDAGLIRLDRATNQLDPPIKVPGLGAFAATFDIALQ